MNKIYDALDSQIARRQAEESSMLERICDLTDILVRIVSDIVYQHEGDVIQFQGDSIIICLPGEVSPSQPKNESGVDTDE